LGYTLSASAESSVQREMLCGTSTFADSDR
jgi:hypothetical protein